MSSLLWGEVQVQHRESVEKGTGTVLNPILFDSTKQSDLTQQIICQKCTINQSKLSWVEQQPFPFCHNDSLMVWCFVFVSFNGSLDLLEDRLDICLKDIPHVCCTTDLQVYSRWGLSFPCVLAFADPNRWQIRMFADLEARHCWRYYQKTNITRFQTADDLGHDKFHASRA